MVVIINSRKVGNKYSFTEMNTKNKKAIKQGVLSKERYEKWIMYKFKIYDKVWVREK